MSRRARATLRRDEGVVTVLMVFAVVALVGIAALVIDLAAVRNARAVNQARSDAAAAAAAAVVPSGTGEDVCRTALGYVAANALGSGSLVGDDCSSFPESCSSATPAAFTSAANEEIIVRVTYPVPDEHPLMGPGGLGAPDQPAHSADGVPCERVGVEIEASHDSFFAPLLGISEQRTGVHTVALADPVGGGAVISLLLLEREECLALISEASGGGLVVGAMTEPETGDIHPGVIAVDSDGTLGCSSSGTLDVNGSAAGVRADGSPGCPEDTGGGRGCGLIRLHAPGPPGCVMPACSSSGTVSPSPTELPVRITRAPVDHHYNCKPSYPESFDIEGCREASAPHIDNLIAELGQGGTPGGWQRYTAAGYPCSVSNGEVVVPAGNWHVDCPTLAVRGSLIFSGGSVVFDGRVTLESQGLLAVNTVPGSLAPAGGAAVAYMRNGLLTKSGQASLVVQRSLLYLSPTSELSMTGGSGALRWSAPVTGAFENLVLWSDSAGRHDLAGQANLSIEGLLFAPHATVSYRGNGSQVQVAAQFVSRRLEVGGNGSLNIQPSFDRALRFGDAGSRLIR